ncbi:succinylglutamate desuccinylase/aspartoacylase family protein [Algiphilus aromaticivorans]|uniref:succinylglutamate desuccinylase/aspartoacylase family protein n=1 Tax=Algiphilus aromaticivorans TaxID=382454 RepID=UPI000694F035|nr:succinylglutamate desuccinylase/aspartoacylase family protein [Algiphilus aromaticivorans]
MTRFLTFTAPLLAAGLCSGALASEADAEQTATARAEAASDSTAAVEDPPTAPLTLTAQLEDMTGDVPTHAAFELLSGRIPPGETLQVPWYASDSFTGLAEPTPVLVAHGTEPGPVLCLTAAVHGDELNGIEMVRRLLYEVDPENLQGTLIGVPIVNLFGFRQGSRYLPDRRDLNRFFPGDPAGSAASRIAYSLFENIIRRCDALVDLHTGSFHRSNLPQLRADMSNEAVAELTRGFGATAVLNSTPPGGTLRGAATAAGVPTVTLEAGEPMRFQQEEVEHGVRALRSLLNRMGMVKRFSLWGDPQPIYYESHWVRADNGGILTSRVDIGQNVTEGALLGTVTDPITNRRSEIHSPYDGRILGMALNQAVIPGFAAYHIGVQRQQEELVEPADTGGDEPASGDPGKAAEGGGDNGADDEAHAAQPIPTDSLPAAPNDSAEDAERPD